MKRLLATLALSMVMPLGLGVSAQALPLVPQVHAMTDSAFHVARNGYVDSRPIGPVIPQGTPMRDPAYPSVPLPPPSTAVPSTVDR
jgi:hypothetical protein